MRDIPKRSGTRQPPTLLLPSGNVDRSTSQNSAKLTAFRLILQLFLLEMDRNAFTRREHVVDATIDANHAIKKRESIAVASTTATRRASALTAVVLASTTTTSSLSSSLASKKKVMGRMRRKEIEEGMICTDAMAKEAMYGGISSIRRRERVV